MFPPQFRNLPDPQLELFDLDEAFSSDKSRLAQVRISKSIKGSKDAVFRLMVSGSLGKIILSSKSDFFALYLTLVKVTNKCGEEDLEYYIREYTNILGVLIYLCKGDE